LERKFMTGNRKNSSSGITHSLIHFEKESEIDIRFVQEEAGDLDTPDPKRTTHELERERRGPALYSDMLFALTNEVFRPDQARELWDRILEHRNALQEQLRRNPGVVVAATDYFLNVSREMKKTVILSERKFTRIAEVALKDGLTGLYDHASFHSKLEQEIQRFIRYGNEVSILMADIDDFKEFNDRHGHPAGDEVLEEMGEILRSEVRFLDTPARYGGEEFTVVLPQTGLEEALLFGERLRRHTEQRFLRDGRVTISVGVASCPQHARTSKALVERVDEALYKAKSAGKNTVQAP
jgi:diguanylate cyclase (GGDEF)-like protein